MFKIFFGGFLRIYFYTFPCSQIFTWLVPTDVGTYWKEHIMKQHTYQKKFIYPLIYPILLTLFTILCVFLMMPADSVFGSQGD